MSKIKDMKGFISGKLTVIGPHKRKNQSTYWFCKCECGKEKWVPQCSLKRGTAKSCGCLRNYLLRRKGKYNPDNMIGKRFGKLLVISESEKKEYGKDRIKFSMWDCECDCGNKTTVAQNRLVSKTNPTKSCGCLQKETATKHGYSRDESKDEYRVYNIWRGIIRRCTWKKDPGFHRYGGRGIQICERWKDSFESFLEDMGVPPTKEHSIDRINNNGNYEPSNCRWATRKQQAQNKGY